MFKMLGAVGFVVCAFFGMKSEEMQDEGAANKMAVLAAVNALWGEFIDIWADFGSC